MKLASYIVNECKNLSLEGLMCIGRPQSDGVDPSADFRTLVGCRAAVAEALQIPVSKLQLSMGMSADFELAVRKCRLFIYHLSTSSLFLLKSDAYYIISFPSYFAFTIIIFPLIIIFYRSRMVQPRFAWARPYSVLETSLDTFNAKSVS